RRRGRPGHGRVRRRGLAGEPRPPTAPRHGAGGAADRGRPGRARALDRRQPATDPRGRRSLRRGGRALVPVGRHVVDDRGTAGVEFVAGDGTVRPGRGLPVSTAATLRMPAVRDLVELTKPGILVFSVMTAAGAMSLAPGAPAPATWLPLLVGTGLLVGSANALNMYLERDVDCRMA